MTTTTSQYLTVSENLSRYQAMTAAEPAVKYATAYYEANIGKVTSIQDFVGNYRLLSYALNAYGLGDQINNTALITQVLQGGVSSSKSLANTLSNSNWKAFATAFNFVGSGAASVSTASAVQTTTSDYVEQQLESDQGNQDVGVQLALYFKRVAPTVSSEYGILADKNLVQVAETIFDLPVATTVTGVDKQAASLTAAMPLSTCRIRKSCSSSSSGSPPCTTSKLRPGVRSELFSHGLLRQFHFPSARAPPRSCRGDQL